MNDAVPNTDGFTAPVPIDDGRGVVAVISCEACGAALLLDASAPFDVVARHRLWHEQMDLGGVSADAPVPHSVYGVGLESAGASAETVPGSRGQEDPPA